MGVPELSSPMATHRKGRLCKASPASPAPCQQRAGHTRDWTFGQVVWQPITREVCAPVWGAQFASERAERRSITRLSRSVVGPVGVQQGS